MENGTTSTNCVRSKDNIGSVHRLFTKRKGLYQIERVNLMKASDCL